MDSVDKIFRKFNFEFDNNILEKFEKYYDLLIYFNDKFNITAITEKEEVINKHFVDSLLGVDNFNVGKLIDIGSGGGFPAIPIAICKSDLKVTLLEATGKKCEFLKTVANELNLKNVTVINGRAEELAFDNNYREKFDYASARAVARLNMLCEYTLPFIKIGGHFISYKGDATLEIEEAKNAIKILGCKIDKINNFDVVYGEEQFKRTIIDIEKVKSTDKKYPRSNGKIRKMPL